MADSARAFIADSPFERDCLRVLRTIASHRNGITLSQISRKHRWPNLKKILEHLKDAEEITESTETPKKGGRPRKRFKLARPTQGKP